MSNQSRKPSGVPGLSMGAMASALPFVMMLSVGLGLVVTLGLARLFPTLFTEHDDWLFKTVTIGVAIVIAIGWQAVFFWGYRERIRK